jgi:predicted ester cyclase
MDRRLFLTRTLVAGAAVFVLPAETEGLAMTSSLVDRFAATLSAHDITAFAALFSDEYVNHQMSAATGPPIPNGKSAKQNSVDFFAARLAGMPDLSVTVETSLITPDKVAASFVYTGTHGGTYFGVAPTGRRLHFTSCDIFRVKDGLLAEHWGMGDIAGILAQLRGTA